MWQANSHDLNPVDYRVWDMLQLRMYRVRIRDTDELRKRLVATWAEFHQSVMNYATVLLFMMAHMWSEEDKKVIDGGGAFDPPSAL